MVACGFLHVDCLCYVAFSMQCLMPIDSAFIVNLKSNSNNKHMGHAIATSVYFFACKHVLAIHEKLRENFKRGFHLNIKI